MCLNQKSTEQTFLNVMAFNRPINIPNSCICIWTHDIAHFSSRISIYPWEQFNNIITKIRSKSQPPRTNSSRSYYFLEWLNTAPEMTNVTRNSWFTKVGSPPSMLHTSCIHQTVFRCLTPTSVLWYEVVWKNWMLPNNDLMLWYIIPKIKMKSL